MAVSDLTGTKWLLEQGWTATSGFGQFFLDGVIYDTNDSLQDDSISHFYIGYGLERWEPTPSSNYIIINLYPTVLTSTYYYEFEITGGTDVTNTTLINWLETNATQIIEPSTPSIADKLQELLDIKQDIKEAIENKGIDLTGGGSQGETWVINETLTDESFQINNIPFISNEQSFIEITRSYLPAFSVYKLLYNDTFVYDDNSGWENEAYRTIIFDEAPTGSLLTWLEANAVKQTTGVAFSGYAEKIDLLPAVVELTQEEYDELESYDDNTYYLIVEEVAPSISYTVTKGNGISQDFNDKETVLFIKFNTPPTNDNDYDWCFSGYLRNWDDTNPTTFGNVTKMYVFDKKGSPTKIKINEEDAISVPSFSNYAEIDITENCSISVLYYYD